MDNITQKYEYNVLKYLDKENVQQIVSFLEKEKCNFIDDIMEDYLDLFLINYEDFVNKYRVLNMKYDSFLEKCSMNMDLLEEFYNV